MNAHYGNAEKRQQIVETAYGLFKRNGFHATGIDRIIADAGVAKMTMYRHFPTKDALIVEVLNYRSARFERQLDELNAATSSPSEKVAQIFDWYERWFRSSDFHGCVFQHALAEFGDADDPVFEVAAAQKKSLKARIENILSASMPPTSASSTATALLILLEGATLLAQMGQGEAAICEARAAGALLVSAGAA
ncbi:TetR/AcrR family transcriptional regulator [Agrobacterium tumefaciens]|uniref:TetR/AcrR family transcriptional regulator n=1 Tax=Agrobacterium tumefaciens TaxID=358 RepID=A0AA44FA67_AGRTU|nr:TetR/AcrR family transcriptional regulator [Agrobacterium tumefaciens]NTB87715.1 TetR/AcrR family transcriptional regulator [Agrobacterium tumefaciens]NTC32062.1 TetR/AcrR family transcriptional regulator [Agrobacterium tumefaciens]